MSDSIDPGTMNPEHAPVGDPPAGVGGQPHEPGPPDSGDVIIDSGYDAATGEHWQTHADRDFNVWQEVWTDSQIPESQDPPRVHTIAEVTIVGQPLQDPPSPAGPVQPGDHGAAHPQPSAGAGAESSQDPPTVQASQSDLPRGPSTVPEGSTSVPSKSGETTSTTPESPWPQDPLNITNTDDATLDRPDAPTGPQAGSAEDSKQFFHDLLDSQWPQPRETAERLRERWGFNVQVERTPDEKLNDAQTALDAAGLIPVYGEVADGANAFISLLRGNYGDAALSAGAMVPVIGTGATGAKWATRASKAASLAEREFPTVKKLADQTRKLAPKERSAASEALAEYKRSREAGMPHDHAASRAGQVYHDKIGAAGSQQGVDLHGKGWQKEVKTHWGPMHMWPIHAAESQSLRYSLQHQAKTGGLTPIRLVEHVYIDPKTGNALKLVL